MECLLHVLGPKQTDLIQSELTNLIRVAMQKGQSCFLIHFEWVGLFDPLPIFIDESLRCLRNNHASI